MRILDDRELEACRPEDVIAAYKELRDAMAKKDRSTILRMAGNIASGLNRRILDEEDLERCAKDVVLFARAIITEVDQ